jgi:hypothetical protein
MTPKRGWHDATTGSVVQEIRLSMTGSMTRTQADRLALTDGSWWTPTSRTYRQ